MRFEAKKKALSTAVKTVHSMTSALAAAGSTVDALHLIAEGKVLKLRTVAGPQIVESIVSEGVIVQEEGTAVVAAAALSNALTVGGDIFKVSRDKQYLDFACGRSKGRLEVKGEDNDNDEDPTESAPTPSIRAPGFKNMLKAITLKGTGKAGERTFHLDAKSKTLRGEATDNFRGITVVSPVSSNDKLPGSISLSLPAKAMDVLGFLIDDCLIGFDEKMFSIKSPGLFVSLPQNTSSPVDIAGQLKDWLATQQKKADFEVSIKEIKEAISDAIAISSDKSGSSLTVSLSPNGGRMLGAGDAGKVETDFAIVATDATNLSFDAQIAPNFLRECLDFYLGYETVVISVYNQAIVLGLTEPANFLSSQTTAIPLLAEVEEKAVKAVKKESAPSSKKAEKAEEAPAPAKAKKPAPPVDEDEAEGDDEEAPLPPPKAKKTAPVEADDDEEEEESFDDDEE